MTRRLFVVIGLILLLGLVACGDEAAPDTAVSTAPAAITTDPAVDPPAAPATATMPPPTATVEPMAAVVNGRGIPQAAFEQELARYEQAQAELGNELPADYRTIVLDALIERELIAQAAERLGIAVTDDMVQAEVAALRESVGGNDNLAAWLTANQWTEADFAAALQSEMVTEQVVTAVTADVPAAVPQVRARYIQVDDAALAQSLLDQIRAGSDFGALATQNSLDQVTAPLGGDLGYFARGSLLVPQLEEAAFALAIGETSEVVAVTDADGQTTYYIIQVTERDEERPLPAELRYNLLEQAFDDWLQTQWAQATVERFSN